LPLFCHFACSVFQLVKAKRLLITLLRDRSSHQRLHGKKLTVEKQKILPDRLLIASSSLLTEMLSSFNYVKALKKAETIPKLCVKRNNNNNACLSGVYRLTIRLRL
jgi:hypothetical protein